MRKVIPGQRQCAVSRRCSKSLVCRERLSGLHALRPRARAWPVTLGFNPAEFQRAARECVLGNWAVREPLLVYSRRSGSLLARTRRRRCRNPLNGRAEAKPVLPLTTRPLLTTVCPCSFRSFGHRLKAPEHEAGHLCHQRHATARRGPKSGRRSPRPTQTTRRRTRKCLLGWSQCT